jgi:hypothetical protein
MIERFQSDEYTPFMVLSLKAGGVGLNLTAANHVVHFDRWWNPAVEDQATDRAFRIGQHKNVVVHKFVTKGTVEEKIDAMLAEKTELSRQIIPDSGEAWITEMDAGAVRLFTYPYRDPWHYDDISPLCVRGRKRAGEPSSNNCARSTRTPPGGHCRQPWPHLVGQGVER